MTPIEAYNHFVEGMQSQFEVDYSIIPESESTTGTPTGEAGTYGETDKMRARLALGEGVRVERDEDNGEYKLTNVVKQLTTTRMSRGIFGTSYRTDWLVVSNTSDIGVISQVGIVTIQADLGNGYHIWMQIELNEFVDM